MPDGTDRSLLKRVESEVARGAETPDFFSTLPRRDLHAILRETASRALDEILNTGAVSIDPGKRRIFRDIYWKGSFAEDTLLGWEEKIRGQLLHPEVFEDGKIFAIGSFWKRFSKLEDGVATGEVVNYNLDCLPGDPEVREIEYPDDSREYFRKGDRVLLLHYRNDPYRGVYDTIKIIDAQNAIGVMHLGEFPTGTEFSAFVMARHNYPFELATEEDQKLIAGMQQAARQSA